jgi:hypothetical protein
MNGWQVMAAPLTIVVRLGVLLAMVLAAASVRDRFLDGRSVVRRAPEQRPSPPQRDTTIVSAYNAALLDGWPAGELLTFMEAGRRAGTSGEHVRAVISRHWAA